MQLPNTEYVTCWCIKVPADLDDLRNPNNMQCVDVSSSSMINNGLLSISWLLILSCLCMPSLKPADVQLLGLYGAKIYIFLLVCCSIYRVAILICVVLCVYRVAVSIPVLVCCSVCVQGGYVDTCSCVLFCIQGGCVDTCTRVLLCLYTEWLYSCDVLYTGWLCWYLYSESVMCVNDTWRPRCVQTTNGSTLNLHVRLYLTVLRYFSMG